MKNKYGVDVNKIVKELEDVFGFKLLKKPRLILVKTKKEFDKHYEATTPNWVVGFLKKDEIIYYDPEVWEKYTIHKKPSTKEWFANIKHEIVHSFQAQIYGTHYPMYPNWLVEGLATYLSGQLEFFKISENYNEVKKHFDDYNFEYGDAGQYVKELVEKYGMQKIIELMKKASKCKNEKEANKIIKILLKDYS